MALQQDRKFWFGHREESHEEYDSYLESKSG